MIELNSPSREIGVDSPVDFPSESVHRVSEVTLIDIFICLARRKRVILKTLLLALAVGGTLSIVLPVRYTATTEIMPPRQTQSEAALLVSQLTTSSAGSMAALAGGGLGLKNPDEIYIGLLQSRPIADAIIQEFGLAKVYCARDLTGARKNLADDTAIVSERSGLISISVTDKDRQRAAKIANAYTGQLRSLTRTIAVTEASQRRLFYEGQLKQAKDNLIRAEIAFQRVQQQKGLVQPDAQTRALVASIAALRAEVAAKQVELQALLSYSTEKNPSVQMAENQLSSLRDELSRLEDRNPSSSPADLEMGDVPAAGLDFLRAEHELKFQQTLYDLLLKEYEAARLDEAKEGTVIQVVEPAIEPDRHSSPQRAVILIVSACLGIFAGCCLALLLAWKGHMQCNPDVAKKFRILRDAVAWRAPIS